MDRISRYEGEPSATRVGPKRARGGRSFLSTVPRGNLYSRAIFDLSGWDANKPIEPVTVDTLLVGGLRIPPVKSATNQQHCILLPSAFCILSLFLPVLPNRTSITLLAGRDKKMAVEKAVTPIDAPRVQSAEQRKDRPRAQDRRAGRQRALSGGRRIQ